MDLNATLPRRVIVTGASSGIGRAVGDAVIDSGGRVYGLDLRAPAVPRDGLVSRTADLTDPAATAAAFDDAESALTGPPDAVVHCAGVYRWRPISEMTVAEWDRVMRINGTGSFLVAQAAARVMTRGAIVLLSSVAYGRGDAAEPCVAYSASKGAIVSLTQQLAVELGPRGIRVNAVAPGMIDTPMLTLGDTPGAVAALTERLPVQRLGEPADVAAACLFLISEASSYITGATIPVDGGYLIS
ncbi:SDR family oxidoreductase [Leucobacter rhizosphaerae]|uniref:SDR family oxidoreductase n=1 Tax=Leucobacter rhizosphaerae TaxID=2932245 RepID=A0ABY4FV95_9MICO|nr:SDR family NAD(P)-dependent oxidoreductase [Leucobacter rhizosphaerae]UOQ60188.1 SDR family oxidoreductase [Leucobacter rhizosphaerae]